MSDLENILNEFQQYVYGKDNKILDHILPNERMTAAERAAIYAEGFYLRLAEVSEIDYPVIQKILGDEEFEKLANGYTDAYLPNHFSVNLFGRNMAEYLRSRNDLDPFYAEMADFEWQLQQVLNTEDADQITVEAMGQVPPESWGMVQFTLHPSVKTLDFHYNVGDVWKAYEKAKRPPKKVPEFIRSEEPVTHMFWRFKLQGFFVALDLQQAWMLKAMSEGKTFGEICAGLCEWIDEEQVATFAATTLHGWISEGVCSELKVLETA